MKKIEKVAVIGAGPAGMSAAYELKKKGIDVDIFEASKSVGGMAKTIKLWDQLVDLGPHRFFSSDPRVNKLWLESLDNKYTMVSRLTRIYYKKTFFNYPIKAFNALSGLGIIEAVMCVLSYIKLQIFPYKDNTTFESWVSNRFGTRLYKIFFKAYSEKLWGIPCDQLDADFAAQRIKGLSLFEAIKGALFSSLANEHKTLVDEFAYPYEGAGAVYEKMKEKFLAQDGNIYFEKPVDSIFLKDEDNDFCLIKFKNGEKKKYSNIISSMPITNLLSTLDAPKHIIEHSNFLKFRNTILVYILVKGPSPFPDQWIYVHSPDLLTGRITNFQNWVPEINKNEENTILCLEYWCNDKDRIWSEDDSVLKELATKEIYETGLIDKNSVIDGKVIRIPKCYPVYATGYKNHLKPIEDYLSNLNGIVPIGRYGAFKYNNQDHSILMGFLAAENIADDENHDLWSVNTDYEYQESSKITDSGLVEK